LGFNVFTGFYYGYPNYYGSIIDHDDGSYTAEYTVDKSGMYVLRLALAEQGLNATYFNGTSFGQLFDDSFDSKVFIQSLQGRAVNYGSSISWTGDIGGNFTHDGSRGQGSYFGMYHTRNEPIVNVSNIRGIQPYLNSTSSPAMKYNFRDHFWSARWMGMITPLYPEVYKFTVEIDDNSETNLWLGGVGIQTNQSYLGNHVLNVSLSNRVKFAFYNFSDTRYREFLLEFVHYTGDAHLNIYWESISTPFSLIPATALTHWRNMSHFNLTIHPNTLCSQCSTAFGVSLEVAQVAIQQSFTIYGRDIYGNLQQKGGEEVTMFAIGSNGISFRGKVVDYGNSTYLMTYLPTESGIFRMYVTIGCCVPNYAVGSGAEIESVKPLLIGGKPFLLTITPAPLRPQNSPATGNGLIGGVAGEFLNFSVAFRDLHNNPTQVLDPNVVGVEIIFRDARNGDTVPPSVLNITRTMSGVIIGYRFERNGRFNMSVMLQNTSSNLPLYLPVIGSPFSLSFAPAAPFVNRTVCRGLGMRQASINSVDDATFELQLYDVYYNKIDDGGDKFFIRLFGDSNFTDSSLSIIPFCYDTSGGRYLCLYKPQYARKHQLQVKLLRRGFGVVGGEGLLGQYFTSFDGALLDFQNDAMMSKVDPQILLHWPHGYSLSYTDYGSVPDTLGTTQTPIVKNIAQSIRWTGYLVSPLSDLFTISVQTENLHVQVFLDQQLIFDNSPMSVFDLSPVVSRRVTLLQDSAYSIRIIGQISSSVAAEMNPVSLNLGWSTNTVPFHTISTTYLYSGADEIPFSPFPVQVQL
jgi:hypothetical protein